MSNRIQFEQIANEIDNIHFEIIKDEWLRLGVTPEQATEFARGEILEERAKRHSQNQPPKMMQMVLMQYNKIINKAQKRHLQHVRNRNRGKGLDEMIQDLQNLNL